MGDGRCCLPLLLMVVVMGVGRVMCQGAAGEEVSVVEFTKEEGRDNLAPYRRTLNSSRTFTAFTVCARFSLSFLDGRTSFLSITQGETDYNYVIRMELWMRRVRLVVANFWLLFPLNTKFHILRWYLLCFVHNPKSGQVEAVLDGRAEYTTALTLPNPLKVDKLHLGRGPDIFMNYVGNVSQVNIWSRALSSEEMSELVECRRNMVGDILSWERDLQGLGLFRHTEPFGRLCRRQSSPRYFLFPSVSYVEALYLCGALGSSLPLPASRDDIASLHGIIDAAGMRTPSERNIWTPINDIRTEGVWRSSLDGDITSALFWDKGEPNGLSYENCVYVGTVAMNDVGCDETPASAICRVETRPVFTLRGTGELEARVSFVADQPKAGGELKFRGFSGNVILNDGGVWMWRDADNTTLAVLEDVPSLTYPMGRRKWLYQEQHQLLVLTACHDGQFTCDDGSCVSIEHRCDYKYDCGDLSDENQCVNIRLTKSYQRLLPPQSDSDTLLITTTFRVMTVSVSTEDMKLELSFEHTIMWADKRVEFFNLKDKRLNWLPHSELSQLWTPLIYFINSEENQNTIVDDNTILSVVRQCSKESSDTKDSREVEIFSGACNPLKLARRYKMRFTCEFDLLLYPFDRQTCQVPLLLHSTIRRYVRFHPNESTVLYNGPSKLREYEVGLFRIQGPSACKDSSDLCMEVPLTRLWGNAVLTMYTPSLILLVLSYMTLFFDPTIFEVRIMAALTSLLVMATFFTQSSSSLPTTSYVKMVDLWLLTCILLVFLMVIFHTLVEYFLRQEEKMKEKAEKVWAIGKTSLSTFSEMRHVNKLPHHPPPPPPPPYAAAELRPLFTKEFFMWLSKVTLPIVFGAFVIIYLAAIAIITFSAPSRSREARQV